MFVELATHIPGILLSYAAFSIGIASPGPNVLAIMGTSMSNDRPSGAALDTSYDGSFLCFWGIKLLTSRLNP